MCPSLMMPFWRMQPLRRGSQKDEPGCPSQWRPQQPHHQGARGYPGARIGSLPTPQEMEEPSKELAPTEVSTEEAAPTEELGHSDGCIQQARCSPCVVQGEQKGGGAP